PRGAVHLQEFERAYDGACAKRALARAVALEAHAVRDRPTARRLRLLLPRGGRRRGGAGRRPPPAPYGPGHVERSRAEGPNGEDAMIEGPVSRRTMLKGIGTVAIGLPFLEEMLASTASASEATAVPARAFNVFFGLGVPAPLQEEGFDGVLEPLRPPQEPLAALRHDA